MTITVWRRLCWKWSRRWRGQSTSCYGVLVLGRGVGDVTTEGLAKTVTLATLTWEVEVWVEYRQKKDMALKWEAAV